MAGASGGAMAAAGGLLAHFGGKGMRKAAKFARIAEQESINRAKAYYQPYNDISAQWRQPSADFIGSAVAPEWAGYSEAMPGQFEAPTADGMYADPSYKFRLEEGQRALENSAAARGGLLSGNTGRALQDYGQGAASQEYGNIWGRAMDRYNTNLQRWGVGRNAAVQDYDLGNRAWTQNLDNAWNKVNYGTDIASRLAGIERGSQVPYWTAAGRMAQGQLRGQFGMGMAGAGADLSAAQMGSGGGGGGGGGQSTWV